MNDKKYQIEPVNPKSARYYRGKNARNHKHTHLMLMAFYDLEQKGNTHTHKS